MSCDTCLPESFLNPDDHIILGGPFNSLEECINSNHSPIAYFTISDSQNQLVIQLTDENLIDSARKQIIGLEPKKHIMGNIIKSTIWYNPDYSYYFDPSSISFFELAMEVCDATFEYTEQNLSEAGGAFLPGLTLCPWSSYIVEEVYPALQPDPSAPQVLASQKLFYKLTYPDQDYLVFQTNGAISYPSDSRYLNATILSGSQPYNNSSLSVYLDPNTLSLSNTPIGIEANNLSLVAGLSDGAQVYFDLASVLINQLPINDRLFCYGGLVWSPTLQQSGSNFYISGSCSGSCGEGFLKEVDSLGLYEACIPDSTIITTTEPPLPPFIEETIIGSPPTDPESAPIDPEALINALLAEVVVDDSCNYLCWALENQQEYI